MEEHRPSDPRSNEWRLFSVSSTLFTRYASNVLTPSPVNINRHLQGGKRDARRSKCLTTHPGISIASSSSLGRVRLCKNQTVEASLSSLTMQVVRPRRFCYQPKSLNLSALVIGYDIPMGYNSSQCELHTGFPIFTNILKHLLRSQQFGGFKSEIRARLKSSTRPASLHASCGSGIPQPHRSVATCMQVENST